MIGRLMRNLLESYIPTREGGILDEMRSKE